MSAEVMSPTAATDLLPKSSPTKPKEKSSKKRKHAEAEVTVSTNGTESQKKKKKKDGSSKSKSKTESSQEASSSSQPIQDDSQDVMDITPDSDNTQAQTQEASITATSVEIPTPVAESPFVLKTASLYVPLSPISISKSTALSSLLAEHLSPLLLSYYAPFEGVILAYDNAVITSDLPSRIPKVKPQPEPNADEDTIDPSILALAKSAGEYGVLYLYITARFLVFAPQRHQEITAWMNVQSEGFVGAVAYNLFSVGIEQKRIPEDWIWVAPGESMSTNTLKTTTSSVEKLKDADDDTEANNNEEEDVAMQDVEATAEELETPLPPTGHFISKSTGAPIPLTLTLRIVDIEIVPGADRDKGFLSLEATLLSRSDEAILRETERAQFERFGGKIDRAGMAARRARRDAAEKVRMEHGGGEVLQEQIKAVGDRLGGDKIEVVEEEGVKEDRVGVDEAGEMVRKHRTKW